MKRQELLEAYLAHTEAAAACAKRLKTLAGAEFETEQVAVSWKMAGLGKVETGTTRDRVIVNDERAFVDWLARSRPSEVVYTARNWQWVREVLLPKLTPVDPEECAPGEATMCADAEGTIVPGVEWRAGGQLHAVSITGDPGLKRALAAAAAEYALTGRYRHILAVDAADGEHPPAEKDQLVTDR